MKIRLYSDLHREFDGWEVPVIENEQDYVVVLAGDIGCGRKAGTLFPFLTDLAARHKAVVYTPGNHEYYGDSFDRAWKKITGELQGADNPDNLHFLNYGTVDIDGVRFIGCTLWTDMDDQSPKTLLYAGMYMNDYRAINRLAEVDTDDGYAYRGKLTPAHTVAEHYAMREWIDNELYQANRDGITTFVVTHHGPTLQSVGVDYVGDTLNGAYVTNLSELIRERAPQVWVHGHIHEHKNYTEGKTLVMTNPKGYPYRLAWKTDGDRQHENPDFREDGLVPEIDEKLTRERAHDQV